LWFSLLFFNSLLLFTTFRNRRRTIHSILSLVARFSRPVQHITTTFACLVACPRYYCCFSFLFFSSSSSPLSLVARCSEKKRVQSAQIRARVCVHARPRTRDNKCFSSMFYACACVCCSSLKSISRPSLYSRVLSLFSSSLHLCLLVCTYAREQFWQKKNWRRNESEKEKRSHMVPRPKFFFLLNRYEYFIQLKREWKKKRRNNYNEHTIII